MSEPDMLRRLLLEMAAAAPFAAGGIGKAMANTSEPTGTIRDFDFLRGRWRVRHEAFIRSRWRTFDGEVSSRPLLSGQANYDDNFWHFEGKPFRALTVRVFDPKTRQWSIFWIDTRSLKAFGPPVVGGFRGRQGWFFGDDQSKGRPVRVRFHWIVESHGRALWEQSYSSDQGRSWEPNWRMLFDRLA